MTVTIYQTQTGLVSSGSLLIKPRKQENCGVCGACQLINSHDNWYPTVTFHSYFPEASLTGDDSDPFSIVKELEFVGFILTLDGRDHSRSLKVVRSQISKSSNPRHVIHFWKPL